MNARPAAQAPTVQDCLGAIPVCQQIYVESLSPSGAGNYPNEVNASISCSVGEINTIWYTFTTQEPGMLGFVIIPNNLNDDYDWSLFNITNASCAEIFTNPALEVSCNVAGGGNCHGATGATGGTMFDSQGPGCGTFPPGQNFGFSPFNDLVPMEAGETYVLMISNWTGSTFGYTLDFGLSTGLGIIDETPPEIAGLQTPDRCNESLITVEFSENIQCSSIGSGNFQLTGPGGPYSVSLVSNLCNQGAAYTNTFLLSINPPIASLGDFTIELVADGTTDALDLCGNPAQPVSFSFEVSDPIQLDIDIGADTSLLCVGDMLLLDAFVPGGSYLWQDGSSESTFEVSSEGVYSVIVTDACGQGSDDIQVIYLMDVPQISLGNDAQLCSGETLDLDVSSDFSTYLWQDGFTGPVVTVVAQGLYSVEVTNACGTTADEILVEYIPPVNLELGPDQTLCAGETLLLDASAVAAVYLWQDGSAGPTYSVVQNGVYMVTVTTPCEERTDMVSVFFIEESEPPGLGEDRTLCPGDSLTFDLTLPGAVYLWQNGSTAPVFTVVSPGDYAVTITTECNTYTDAVSIAYLDPIKTELGRDTFLCPGETILLNAAAGTVASYQWQDRSTQPVLTAELPGVYQVTVYNDCESVTDQITIEECEICKVYVPTAFSPNDDGVNDEFKPFSDCALENFRMQVYDRWGALLFESTDPNQGWNGKFKSEKLLPGVFVWWMEYTVLENGRPRSEVIMGDVALVK